MRSYFQFFTCLYKTVLNETKPSQKLRVDSKIIFMVVDLKLIEPKTTESNHLIDNH